MSGSAAELNLFEPSAERFGPRPDPAAQAILVGLDGSDTAMRAAAYAFGMARRGRNRLIVAFVVCHPVLATLSLAVVGTADVHQAALTLYIELRDHIRSVAEELEVSVTLVKAFGDPFTTLRDTADRCQVDTVVVGASQQAGHRIAGSVASKLIRAGHWPVLVVP
jgi:nucleotide-binding universal stress UspA family protein